MYFTPLQTGGILQKGERLPVCLVWPLPLGYREVIWGKRGVSSAQGSSRCAEVRMELLVCWPQGDGDTVPHVQCTTGQEGCEESIWHQPGAEHQQWWRERWAPKGGCSLLTYQAASEHSWSWEKPWKESKQNSEVSSLFVSGFVEDLSWFCALESCVMSVQPRLVWVHWCRDEEQAEEPKHWVPVMPLILNATCMAATLPLTCWAVDVNAIKKTKQNKTKGGSCLVLSPRGLQVPAAQPVHQLV